MEWSPQDAMKAYLHTLHLVRDPNPAETTGVVEPQCLEFISALAAGKRAKLIVEITTQGVTPLTVALGVAAKQSGGQLICILVDDDGDDHRHVDVGSMTTGLDHVMKLVRGISPCEMLMQLNNVDFAVIDCKFHGYLKLFREVDVNPSASTVIVHNLHRTKAGVSFAQIVKRTKGVESVTLPIGEGIELTRIGGFLRAARSKPCEDRCQIESIVSAEFRRNSKQVDRKNFFYIEYLLRRGKKQLDQLKSPDTMGLSSLNDVAY
ncbi:hypothetical protein SCA6_009719 [Theobroma cacao]